MYFLVALVKKKYYIYSGIVFDEVADRYANKKGLFVIGQSGETVKILNDKKFTPRSC